MSELNSRLSARVEQLLRQSATDRYQLGASLDGLVAAAGRIDRGLAVVRRFAAPPLVVAGGLALALLVRRTGVRRAVAGSVTALGLLLRARSTTAKVTGLGRPQPVRRSR